MIIIFEREASIKGALERSLSGFLGDAAEVVVANTDQLNSVRDFVEEGKVVVFYGFSSEATLRIYGNPAVPYLYYKNTGYCQLPFNLIDVATVYKDICDGKKIENGAAILSAKVGIKNSRIGILLHDLLPGKNLQKPLEEAKKEFGISGDADFVRNELLKNLKGATPIKDIIGEELLKGVFCDIEGTLLSSDGTINKSVLRILKEKKRLCAVSLWTGGDTIELQKKIYRLGVKDFPVLSKYNFRGCNVEVAFDDLPKNEFEERYDIKAGEYIKI